MQLRDLAAGLAARGHQVVVATRPSAQWERACATARVRHAPVPMRGSLDLRSAWALARLIRDQHDRGRALPEGPRPLARPPRRARHHDPGDDPEPRGELPGRPLDAPRLHHPAGHRDRGGVRVDQARAGRPPGCPAAKIDVIYSGTDLARFHPGVDGRRIRGRARARPRPRPRHPGGHPLVARQRRRAGGDGPRLPRRPARAPALRGRAAAAHPDPARSCLPARHRPTRSRCSAIARTSRRSSPPAIWWWTPPTPGSG